jgi:predicted Rossmann fold nucleotide-binding protein DprA/Smf involved in DNA uptake
MTSIEQLVQSIDAHLEELRVEIEALTRARQKLLANGAGSGRPTPVQGRRRARRRDRGPESRRSTEVVPTGRLHRLLAASDGLSTATLAEQANAEPAQVLPLLREMEAAGRVRRTGERRGTRWHAVASDEEWIAQRAAELAGRSRSA